MKINFIWLGKSKQKEYSKLIDEYKSRLGHYVSCKVTQLKEPKLKSKNVEEIRKIEAKEFLSSVANSDYVVLLDERGKHFTSIELSNWIQHKQNISIQNVVFIIAGAYGAHSSLKERADFIFSLSHLTLTHDMARIFIIEQVYRAFTILKGEKYHNE